MANHHLIFPARINETDTHAWITDGTAAGTHDMIDWDPVP
jgi:hypothetical protein